jgi:hypothetical protein
MSDVMIIYDELERTGKETYRNYLNYCPGIWLEELHKLASNFITTVNFKDRAQQPVQTPLKSILVNPAFRKSFLDSFFLMWTTIHNHLWDTISFLLPLSSTTIQASDLCQKKKTPF